MKIQVLGTGCAKCKLLAEQTERAVQELGLDVEVEKVTGINEILDFGVMMTPALAIDGEVKVAGKVPAIDELKDMLK
jgi:small redox-active disulfide protein 2